MQDEPGHHPAGCVNTSTQQAGTGHFNFIESQTFFFLILFGLTQGLVKVRCFSLSVSSFLSLLSNKIIDNAVRNFHGCLPVIFSL
jgi:hypothetical protein